ncbi:AMP binding protein [Boletus edulis BED1]|uniref:AMP binding protein n=1 Tax=Boletus edulis BED1 TaxID=1328754 RepID=A0AAD4GJX6_BOLED|nr:AMP binding protein [Boletus edulis BED1]
MKLLTSPYPNVPLFRRSIFTHLLGTTPDTPHLIGGFPASSPAFIDAATATVLSRATLRSYALQFAFSLHDLPAPLAYTPNPTTPSTVLIFSPNTIVWPILLHGVAAAGLRTTLANSAFTSSELAYQYANANASLIFTHPSLLSVVLDALKSLGCTESEIRSRVILISSNWLTGVPDPESTDAAHLVRLDAFFGRGELQGEVSFDGERSNETLYLCYSSGTTGKPKGVETTHYNLVSLIEILRPSWPSMIPCLTPFLPADTQGPHPDVFFGSLPYFHIYGAIKLLMFPLSLGTPAVIMSGFDPMRFCEAVERYRATIVLVVPPMLVVLARHEAIEKYNMTSIHTLYSGAAPLGADLVATIRKRLQKVGADVIVSQAYGLTETSPTMIVLHPNDANTHIGSVGRVLPNLEVQLVREDAGEIITDIEGAGEIWVRGPTVMKGYLNNPSATASAITPDGWFKTGDIAISDAEGFITIIDRRKELIKYKVVAPAELEALLLQHPDVTDAAVVGVDSKEEATELPRAYIVPTGPITPRESAVLALEVQAWVADRVAAHKKLRGGIITVDGIPKSASGKILRRELRERAKGEVGHGQVGPRVKL